jgi:thioesterase domain-containing protein
MLLEARDRGIADQFMDTLVAVSKFRPSFGTASAGEVDPEWVRLCEGDAHENVICLPTALALSGPHQYVRFAKAFQGSRTVSALALPGFAPGERLPESLEAVVEALALAVERRSGDEPFVLVGYSSGGWLVNAMTSRLERGGEATVAAVVLLDSHPAARDTMVGVLQAVLSDALTDEMLGFVNDDRLMAMGAYLRLLADWGPVETAAPSLFVRASEPLPGVAAQAESERGLEFAGSEIEVAGNHFTMMDEHVDATAQAVREWLSMTLNRQGARDAY